MQFLKVIRDGLIIAFLPRRINKYLMKNYEFAWLVQPRSINDFYRKFPLGKFLPQTIKGVGSGKVGFCDHYLPSVARAGDSG